MKTQGESKGDALRKRAEMILSQRPQDIQKIPVEDIKRLIHELDVHQIELDMQNDELRKAQAELELSRAKYVDLYDFAPVGYFTLTATGRIEDANLTGAKLLGVERTNLANRNLRSFIAPESMNQFESHLLVALASDVVQKCELKLIKKGGIPLDVSLKSISAKPGDKSGSFIRSAMIDMTERNRAQKALRESEERCRYLSSQLLIAQESERRRIAGEIHDRIGHGLVNMKHLVEPVLTWMRKEGPETEFKRLELLTSILKDTAAVAKEMQQNLRPSLLEDLGLLATIGWLGREFGEAHPGIRLDQNITIEEEEVPLSLKVVIFRIVQEALNNVVKHSKANLVRLSLNRGSEGFELTLSDDGQGFDVKETPRHGLGLASMRESAESSNGVFSLESVKGKGTTLRVTWSV
jgi:PAS domain S-box-containing protein